MAKNFIEARVKAQVNANVALVDQGLQVLTVHFLKIRPQG